MPLVGSEATPEASCNMPKGAAIRPQNNRNKRELASLPHESSSRNSEISRGKVGRGINSRSVNSPLMTQNFKSSIPKNISYPCFVVILEKAGLIIGKDYIMDAYDRGDHIEITNLALMEARVDIVHQCLLALFDSESASRGNVLVYINTVKGRLIELSPRLRPPRSLKRFKGLITTLFRDNTVKSPDGDVLMRMLPGGISSVIPFGAPVTAFSNVNNSPIMSSLSLGEEAFKNPVDNSLQGGVKNVCGFYCISCTEELSYAGVDYITRIVSLSAYPVTAHIAASRICQGISQSFKKLSNDHLSC